MIHLKQHGAIMELICEDLKFRDKQNDFKYML